MKKTPNKKGFISLFTVLLATVILAISVGMSSVALKQIVLTSNVDEANEAFYAADSGLQCAIMLDIQGSFEAGGNVVDCGSVTGISTGGPGTFIFSQDGQTVGFDWSNGNCVKITVDKTGTTTRIEALGHNISCAELAAGTNPKAVERALRVRY